MASIRRTLSPVCHDRTIQLPLFSPPHKFLSDAKCSSPLCFSAAFSLSARRFIAGAFLQRYPPRKGHLGWRRAFSRCGLFFLFGLLPFGHVDNDIRSDDFSFEIKPSHANALFDNASDGRTVRQEVSVADSNNLMVKLLGEVKLSFDSVPRKQLIVVTPAYNRAFQAYFLNKLSQTLRLAHPPLLWIIVEMHLASMETADILRKTGVTYRHLVCTKNMTTLKDRGVHQRNTALEYIEHHKLDGIVYFADDYNIYSPELFESLRGISRFGTWPVAMLAQNKNKAILVGPVCNGSQVIGWHTNEKSINLQRFHVDMSGFAFNSTILWDPKRWQRSTSTPVRQLDTVKEGFQETTFIVQVVEDETQMEGTPAGCSMVMNWHLHLEAPNLIYPKGWLLQKNLDLIMPIK